MTREELRGFEKEYEAKKLLYQMDFAKELYKKIIEGPVATQHIKEILSDLDSKEVWITNVGDEMGTSLFMCFGDTYHESEHKFLLYAGDSVDLGLLDGILEIVEYQNYFRVSEAVAKASIASLQEIHFSILGECVSFEEEL